MAEYCKIVMNISEYLYCDFHSVNLFIMMVRPPFNEDIILMWLNPPKRRFFVLSRKISRAVIRLSLFFNGIDPVIYFKRSCSPFILALIITELFSQFGTNLMVYGLKHVPDRSFWTGENRRGRWPRPCLS